MMTPVDDLRVGMLVAAVAKRTAPPPTDGYVFAAPQEQIMSGKPLKILAKSLPFICVTDGVTTFAVDVRVWDLKRITSKYAKAMKSPVVRQPMEEVTEERDAGRCERCGERMVERRVVVMGQSGWALRCRRCDGGPPLISVGG